MNPIIITLVVIGILAYIISFLIKGKDEEGQENNKVAVLSEALDDEGRQLVKEKVEAVLSDISEEIIVRTDDALDKLSNEKIMAVNDFSEQILEKIRKNHEEVVFLYSMLEDKERELKAAVKEIDLSKKKLQSMMETRSKVSEVKNEENKAVPAGITQVPAGKVTEPLTEAQIKDIKDVFMPAVADSSADRIDNRRILELYSQGKTVLEISKMLDLGQGEVKLVIDLYKGKK